MSIHSMRDKVRHLVNMISRRKGVLLIFGKPDCGKVTPSQLANDDIPTVRKCITDFDWVIAAFAVIFPVFFVFGHNGSGVGGVRTVRHYTRYLEGCQRRMTEIRR